MRAGLMAQTNMPDRASPSHRVLPVRTAGFLRRGLALALDLALVAALCAALGLALPGPLGLVDLPPVRVIGLEYLLELALTKGSALVPLAAGALMILVLYLMVLHSLLGLTLGKLMLGLRVIDSHGQRPGLARSTTRALALLFSLLLLGLGLVWAGFDRQRRAWHDYLAGTYVVSSRSLRQSRASLGEPKAP